jgi:hypothetical protein
MARDLALIISVIVLAILFIAIASYFLQQWLLLRRYNVHPSASTSFPIQENKTPEVLYFEEKLKAHYGDQLPVIQIKTLLSIPKSLDKIILLDDTKSFPNVLRCHSNGWIVWRGELPYSTDDVYTHVEWRNDELTTYSVSGFFATLDLETGKVLSYEFVK